MNAKRIERIFHEIAGDWGPYSVEIGSDAFERFTVTLWYRHPAWTEREQISHCHTNDLVEGVKAALVWKMEDLAQRTKVKS